MDEVFSYSTISFHHGLSLNETLNPSIGDLIFSWKNQSTFKYEIAWLSTPESKPPYLQNPGFWTHLWNSYIVDDGITVGKQRPALL